MTSGNDNETISFDDKPKNYDGELSITLDKLLTTVDREHGHHVAMAVYAALYCHKGATDDEEKAVGTIALDVLSDLVWNIKGNEPL